MASAAVVASLLLAPGAAQAATEPERIGGADRYAVSALVSERTFEPGVNVAYIASGTGFADALSASAMAGLQGGPVLLVSPSGIPAEVAAELTRLAPQRIVVAGGPATVSPAIVEALGAYSSDVARVGGEDRYAVSAGLSSDVIRAGRPVVYVASGAVFPDALSGSAAAGDGLAPVLLTTKDSIPDVVLAEIKRLRPPRIVLLGGEESVSKAVEDQLAESAVVTRIAGVDRYAVSAGVAATFSGARTSTVYVASGEVFSDALSGSAAAIVEDAPVLLVRRDEIPIEIAAELGRLSPARIVVLGGTATISDDVLEQLKAYIRQRS
ncbi:cell wall-binding repeat-containing protein [Herbiconiux sp. P15]|uniref:cell wall-binding repeat-containing protein n=1 Tax=Herbiconiux liukaitaii TaxID=3342799 RepID=UPI0035B9BFDD